MSLTERQRVERSYYDSFYEDLNRSTPDGHLVVDPGRPPIYFAGMEKIVGGALAALGELGGKRVLVVGCGQGHAATWLAAHGATVWALDISESAARMADRVARLNGVADRVHAVGMPAEEIARHFEPGAFDLAYGTEVLHHLDLEAFAPALGRVLAPGARAAFIEPAVFHPLLQLARQSRLVRAILPVHRHTPTEAILTGRSLEVLARTFRVEHHDFAAITFVLGLAWRYRRLGGVLYRLAGLHGLPERAAFEALAGKIFDLDARLVRAAPPARLLTRKTILLLEKAR